MVCFCPGSEIVQESAEKCSEILSKKMEKALYLVAEDLLTDHEIASEGGISRNFPVRREKALVHSG